MIFGYIWSGKGKQMILLCLIIVLRSICPSPRIYLNPEISLIVSSTFFCISFFTCRSWSLYHIHSQRVWTAEQPHQQRPFLLLTSMMTAQSLWWSWLDFPLWTSWRCNKSQVSLGGFRLWQGNLEDHRWPCFTESWICLVW